MKMFSRTSHDDNSRHPFGGCDRLRGHYKTIGQALLSFESSSGTPKDERAFQLAVAFVPIEVLESYLEDLLELIRSEENLFIEREDVFQLGSYLPAAGLIAAMALGIYASSSGTSPLLSFALTVCIALPFTVLWYVFPNIGVARRMRLARLVSQEISRRRGGDSDVAPVSRREGFLTTLIGGKAQGTTQGAAMNEVIL